MGQGGVVSTWGVRQSHQLGEGGAAWKSRGWGAQQGNTGGLQGWHIQVIRAIWLGSTLSVRVWSSDTAEQERLAHRGLRCHWRSVEDTPYASAVGGRSS